VSGGRVNHPKLLLDENLSPSIALTLTRERYDVVHVRDRGLLRATDAEVFARAYEEDRIVVTFNCDDFKKLAQAATVHAGLVFLEDSGLLRDEQLGLVRKALGHVADELIAGRDMINRVLRIWSDSAHVFDPLP
jgi:predicted nuclease of predicted toxin-antitoxin system